MKKLISNLTILSIFTVSILCISCKKEVNAPYSFGVSQMNISSTGTPRAEIVILQYLEDNDYLEIEYYDNEAKTTEEAVKKNDDEAKRDFDRKIQKLNLLNFNQICILAGCQNVSGTFTYALWKDATGNLRQQTYTIN